MMTFPQATDGESKGGGMLDLINLLVQLWTHGGGGAHPNDKGVDFGGSEERIGTAPEALRSLSNRIRVQTLGEPRS